MAIEQLSGHSMTVIDSLESAPPNVRAKAAAGYFYRRAKWCHFGGACVAIVLAVVAPLVLLFAEDAGPLLGAIAGLWIFSSRLLLEPLRDQWQRVGARCQESFDTSVLALPWNRALVEPLPDEEMRAASRKVKKANNKESWYPTDRNAEWPTSVLICQRANAVWARRQQRAYGVGLRVVAGIWLVVGVVVAVADGSTLAVYLTTIALPSLPALLDATELSRRHFVASTERKQVEKRCDELLDSGSATLEAMRETQDSLLLLRQREPLVPNWFYKVIRSGYENDMRYAAGQLVDKQNNSKEAD